jgi:hypothetical protein
LRGSLEYTKVGYNDSYTKNPYQLERNLSFRSDIVEAAVISEFNFFWFTTGKAEHRFTPFLAGGVGAFYFNPYVNYNGRRQYLRPLGTEGQNLDEYKDRRYSNYSMCIPVGFGIKYWIAPGVNFSAEIMNRFTLTDYLDDVSTTYVGSDKFLTDPMHPTPASVLQDPSIPDANGQKLGRAGKQRGDSSSKDQYCMVQFTLSFQMKTYKCPSHNEMW